MRTFTDSTGRCWDAAVGEASYGTQRLIFAVRGAHELRACVLEPDSRLDAEQLLLRLSESELRELLESAAEWQPG